MPQGMPGFSENNALPEPVADCFIGHRTWIVEGDRLLGMTKKEYVWTDGKNVARCLRSIPSIQSYPAAMNKMAQEHQEEGIPTFNCGCGFWAYSGKDMPDSFPGPRVTGVIQAWGKIITGPLGFRAQYARIIAACPKDWDKELTIDLMNRYPTVMWYADYEEMCTLHPSTDLGSFLEKDDV